MTVPHEAVADHGRITLTLHAGLLFATITALFETKK
jgi:hypothetical protein